MSVRSQIDRRVAAGLGRRRSIRGRGAHSSVAFEPLWSTVAGYLMACSAQAANCQTTWLIPRAHRRPANHTPESSTRPRARHASRAAARCSSCATPAAVFVERLWRSVKYEEVYLRAYDSVSEARASIGRYFDFYNGRRPHASLDGNTPIKPTSTRCPWKRFLRCSLITNHPNGRRISVHWFAGVLQSLCSLS